MDGCRELICCNAHRASPTLIDCYTQNTFDIQKLTSSVPDGKSISFFNRKHCGNPAAMSAADPFL